MISTLIGQKLDQAQDFLQNGKRVPVTEIAVTENVVLQIKTVDSDSYAAIQLGAGTKKKPINSALGHAKKAGQKSAPLKIREVSVKDISEDEVPKLGDFVSVVDVFKPGDIVEVTGVSKGKGFAGGVKRHGFKGGPKTHGQSDRHRAPGSIGQGTTPGRVYKGKRMAGRMGTETVTVKNLTVVDVDNEAKKLYVTGLVPGHKNSWVYITRIGEDKKFVPLLSIVQKEEAKAKDEAAANVTEETPVEEVKTEESVSEETPKEVKAASADSSSEPKEVKSETAEGEKKAPDSGEKEEIAKTAEENVTDDKKEETVTEEPVKESEAKTVDTDSSNEPKAAVAESSSEPKEKEENA